METKTMHCMKYLDSFNGEAEVGTKLQTKVHAVTPFSNQLQEKILRQKHLQKLPHDE